MEEEVGSPSLRGLVVDDDPAMRPFIADLLRGLGIETSAVAGQADAEDLLRAVDFDLLIVEMTFADALLGQIRRSRLRRPRAIAICAAPAERPDRFWEPLGAQTFLPKPIDRAALVSFLADALEWRRVGVETAGPSVLLVGGGTWVQEVTAAVHRMGGRIHVTPRAGKLPEKKRLVKPALVVLGPPLAGNDLFMPCAELQQEGEDRPIVLAALGAPDDRLRDDLLGIGVARVHALPEALRLLVEDTAHLAGISRRAAPRAPLSSTVLVHTEVAPIAALAYDISEGGIGVRDLKGDVPAQVDLEIGLPGDERLIRVPAAVAWRSPQADGRERVGMRFLKLATPDAERIRRFVQQPRLVVVPSPQPKAPESAPKAPAPPAKTVVIEPGADGRLTAVFADEEAFRKDYEATIKSRGVYAKTPVKPALRATVEITAVLTKEGKQAALRGEVVFLGPDGVAIQIAPIEPDFWKKAAAATPPAPAAPPPTAPAGPVEPFKAELSDALREAEVDHFGPAEPRLGPRVSWLRVLRSLEVREASGVLTAEKKGERRSFLFRKGRISDSRAEPVRDEDSLIRLARQRKAISAETAGSLPSKATPAEEVDLLKTKAHLKASDVESLRRAQMLDRGSLVFSWTGATAAFDPKADWTPSGSALVSVTAVGLHAVHHGFTSSGEEMTEMMRGIMDLVLRKPPDGTFDPAKTGLNQKETKAWDFASSGENTVRQLLKIAPLPGYQTCRLLLVLLRLGALVLEKPKARTAKSDPVEELKMRAADLKSRDPFGKLGLTWMAAAPQIDAAFASLRRDLAPDLASSGGRATLAKEVLSMIEGAWKLLMDDTGRRKERAKLVEDPGRIVTAAEFLADKADILKMRGDRPGAIASIQMAYDLAPTHPQCRKIALELGVAKA